MVEHIERIHAELHVDPFGESNTFLQRHIEVPDTRISHITNSGFKPQTARLWRPKRRWIEDTIRVARGRLRITGEDNPGAFCE